MTQGKYTAGPWYRDDLLPPNGRPVIARTAGGLPISATTDDWLGSDGEDEANAKLIASSPKLLDALRLAERFISAEVDKRDEESGYGTSMTLDVVRAAINEATGKAAA
jgi:hypothetical protein